MIETADMEARGRGAKSASAFRTISEVSIDLDVPQHVLRFWETKFPQIKPLKRGGGRRYYRPDDVELLRRIQVLLYKEGYTIKGVQRLLKESRGVPSLPANDGPPDHAPTIAPSIGSPPPAVRTAPPPKADPPPSLFDAPPQRVEPSAAPAVQQALPTATSKPSLTPEKRRALEDVLDELLAIKAELKG